MARADYSLHSVHALIPPMSIRPQRITVSSPVSPVAIMYTSHLSSHLHRSAPTSLHNFSDPPPLTRVRARPFGKSRLLGRVVPHKFSHRAESHISVLNHFSTTGRCSGPAHYDVSIRQAARAAFVRSSFKIFLTQTFPRCGATCYILPSRAMTQLFHGVNFGYRSVEVYLTFCSYLRVLVKILNFYNCGRY